MEELIVGSLTKSFGSVTALRKVNFSLKKGEFLSLLGPSGCGKTTTLRLIAGFERPDTGEIRLNGRSVLNQPPERRRVGFVFQNYALFPHMSVAKNVAYGVRFNRKVDTKARVRELLSLVGLARFGKRRPAELSAGQRQRVALARALAPQPRLLLLDEPLSALDAKLRESLRLEIRHIQRRLSLSTLYVTHDQDEALALSDRVVVMQDGGIEQIGTPRRIYEQPQTEFVASFIGHKNRFQGRVSGVEQGYLRLKVGEFSFRVIHSGAEISPNEPVVLFVKEEELGLDRSNVNTIPGEVSSLEYQGEMIVVHLQSSLGPLRARVSASRGNGLNVGERVTLSFAVHGAILFPSSSV